MGKALNLYYVGASHCELYEFVGAIDRIMHPRKGLVRGG